MKKAILLVRVSTEKQNFDEQEKQIYNLAIADGFKDNEIIPMLRKNRVSSCLRTKEKD